jgi:hypothetical protein
MVQVQYYTLLQPVVPAELLAEAQGNLTDTLEEQRILPELRIQDFDDYISLINGEVKKHLIIDGME